MHEAARIARKLSTMVLLNMVLSSQQWPDKTLLPIFPRDTISEHFTSYVRATTVVSDLHLWVMARPSIEYHCPYVRASEPHTEPDDMARLYGTADLLSMAESDGCSS